ncbi:hypothetical protein Tco_0989692 [Tanacetum coccineum]|uniref:Uncharacterized protein n=1 Tax=Tanacetum coccineum TaxID=301880 RepID=A0ABQ5EUY6_9ASTR
MHDHVPPSANNGPTRKAKIRRKASGAPSTVDGSAIDRSIRGCYCRRSYRLKSGKPPKGISKLKRKRSDTNAVGGVGFTLLAPGFGRRRRLIGCRSKKTKLIKNQNGKCFGVVEDDEVEVVRSGVGVGVMLIWR